MFGFIKLLAVIALLTVACAQGGGGGRLRSSSYYHSESTKEKMKACKQKCTTKYAETNKLKLKKCLEVCDPPTDPLMLIGGIVLIGGILGLTEYNERKKRKEFFADYAKSHAELIQDFQISREEEEKTINQLARGKWEFIFSQAGIVTSTKTFQLHLAETADRRHLYRVKLSSSDKHGSWKGEGYISFNASGTSLWLMKDYNDKRKAGQTGFWSYLFYKGQRRITDFEGNWWFKGYETDPTYSGTFTMRKIEEE